MCYNQTGDISTLEGTPLKLIDKFTYLRSSVPSTEKDIDTRLTKAWTAINRLSFIWKSDLTDKMKRSFFQAAVTSILLYGCTTWTLTKWLEKKLDGNYTRMLRAILNKSWRQHPTRHQLYGHLPPITKTIQVRHMAVQKQDDQHEHTFSSYLRIRDVVLKICLGRWTIGRSGERGSGISLLLAWHDDDDDISEKLATVVEGDPKTLFSIATTPNSRGGLYIHIYIYIYICVCVCVFSDSLWPSVSIDHHSWQVL